MPRMRVSPRQRHKRCDKHIAGRDGFRHLTICLSLTGKCPQVERQLDGGLSEKTAVAMKPKPHPLGCECYHLSRITSLVANAPAWAPSGDALIYTEGIVGSDSQIFKINLTNHKLTQLTDDGSNLSGNWFDPGQLPISPSAPLMTTLWGDTKTRDSLRDHAK